MWKTLSGSIKFLLIFEQVNPDNGEVEGSEVVKRGKARPNKAIMCKFVTTGTRGFKLITTLDQGVLFRGTCNFCKSLRHQRVIEVIALEGGRKKSYHRRRIRWVLENGPRVS